jgi:hypothetical protein
MVRKDIITALKNAVEHGESLEGAINTMVASGYSKEDVQEASRFVSRGAMALQQQEPGEQLTMPSQKKSVASKLKFWKKQAPSIQSKISPQVKPFPQRAPSPQAQVKPTLQQPLSMTQLPPEPTKPPEKAVSKKIIGKKTEPLQKQLSKIGKPKTGHKKEIFLLIILLILIGILILTIVFKEKILGFFS